MGSLKNENMCVSAASTTLLIAAIDNYSESVQMTQAKFPNDVEFVAVNNRSK